MRRVCGVTVAVRDGVADLRLACSRRVAAVRRARSVARRSAALPLRVAALPLRVEAASLRVRRPTAVLQLDEPSLTAVLRGRVRTASGYRTHRAVDRQIAEATLRDVVGVHGDGPVVVHSCAPDVPFALLRGAGAGVQRALARGLLVLELAGHPL